MDQQLGRQTGHSGRPRDTGTWWSVLDLAFTVSQDNDIQRIMPETLFPPTKSYEKIFLKQTLT